MKLEAVTERYLIDANRWDVHGTQHQMGENLFVPDGGWLSASIDAERRDFFLGREPLDQRLATTVKNSAAYQRYHKIFGEELSEKLLIRSLASEIEDYLRTLVGANSTPKPPLRMPEHAEMMMLMEAYQPSGEYVLVDSRTRENVPARTLKHISAIAQEKHRTTYENEQYTIFTENVQLVRQEQKPSAFRRLCNGVRKGIDQLAETVQEYVYRPREQERWRRINEQISDTLDKLEEKRGKRAADFYNQASRRGLMKDRLYDAGAAALRLRDGDAFQEVLRDYIYKHRPETVLQRFDLNLVRGSKEEFIFYHIHSLYESTDLTLKEITQVIEGDTGMSISTSTVSRLARQAINKERVAKGEKAISSRRELKTQQEKKAA